MLSLTINNYYLLTTYKYTTNKLFLIIDNKWKNKFWQQDFYVKHNK